MAYGTFSLNLFYSRIARRGLISTGATKAAGGLLGVGTNTVVGDLLDKIEGLFRREDDDLCVR